MQGRENGLSEAQAGMPRQADCPALVTVLEPGQGPSRADFLRCAFTQHILGSQVPSNGLFCCVDTAGWAAQETNTAFKPETATEEQKGRLRITEIVLSVAITANAS